MGINRKTTKAEEMDIDFEEHRDTLKRIGGIISSQQLINLDKQVGTATIYRYPAIDVMRQDPSLRDRDFGEIWWEETEGIYARVGGQDYNLIQIAADPEDALEYLSAVRQVIEENRRELAMALNGTMQKTNSRRNPQGQGGHLLKEYDQLLSQLEHEHFRHRDHVQNS